MKKKIFAAILACSFVFSMTACNGNSEKDSSTKKKNETESEENETDEEASDASSAVDTSASETEATAESETTAETATARPALCEVRGDYVVFGYYEQDGNLENGPEPIEWQVVSSDEYSILLLSRYILDAHAFNSDTSELNWENSELRAWLNNDFLNSAFNAEEQALIKQSTIMNFANPALDIPSGNATQDSIFCLSLEELRDNFTFENWQDELYGGSCLDLVAEVTPYAGENCTHWVWTEQQLESTKDYLDIDRLVGLDVGLWWLRTPGGIAVNSLGGVHTNDSEMVNDSCMGVRPALYLNPSAVTLPEKGPEDNTVTDDGYILMGHYEQDGNLENGPEPVEWIILSEDDEKYLVISRYVLDGVPYHTDYSAVTWENCALRDFLNNDFYNTAFDPTEQSRIIPVTNSNPDNATTSTPGGNDTQDKVFLLSMEEVMQYFNFTSWDDESMHGNCQALITDCTPYAESKGVARLVFDEDRYYGTDDFNGFDDSGYTDDVLGKTFAPWWLRSPGIQSNTALMVTYAGHAGWDSFDRVIDDDEGVRPAMYIYKGE